GSRIARAMWLSGTRPWRAPEAVSGLGRVERVLLVAVPAVFIVASRAIATWFEAPAHLLITLGGWLLFGAVAVLAVAGSGRRGAAWPVLAAVGGAAMLRVVLLMAA
ncbi:hypothetical protein ACC691_37705, partial [Rhizobium johnstonii]|uniref:hypothetical protein n=1 Tax=Rhizobium johnstonii TaxID=3019933 RepID=UPI003F99EFB7